MNKFIEEYRFDRRTEEQKKKIVKKRIFRMFFRDGFNLLLNIGFAAVIVMGMIFIMKDSNMIYAKNNDNLRLEAAIEEMEDQIRETKVKIYMQTSTKNIEKLAVEKFSMIYPDTSGFVVVDTTGERYYALDILPEKIAADEQFQIARQDDRKPANEGGR